MSCQKLAAVALVISFTLASFSGALGPVDGVNPELSNLTCSMTYVEPGDIVFLTSDGISDNFDPVVGKFCVPKRTPDENKSGRINSSQHQQNSSLPAVAGDKI